MTGTRVAGLCRQASPMACTLPRKSAAATGPGTPLVVEADLVRHRMVAEDDRQLVIRLADLPGPIEQLGMADVAPAVAADLAVGRAAQDLLVGRDPLDAVLGQERDHRLADRALAGPHAARPFAESSGVALDGAADVHRRILGVTAAVGRQRHVGHRLAGQRLVEEQGEDRVIVGRRGQLDLAARGQLAMQRDHPRQQLALFVQEPLLLLLGVVPAFGLELGQLGVLLEEQGMDPRQVRPDLEVAEVARAEPARAPAWPSCSTTTASGTARGSGRCGRIIVSGKAMKKLSRIVAGVVVVQAVGRPARERRDGCRWPRGRRLRAGPAGSAPG